MPGMRSARGLATASSRGASCEAVDGIPHGAGHRNHVDPRLLLVLVERFRPALVGDLRLAPLTHLRLQIAHVVQRALPAWRVATRKVRLDLLVEALDALQSG